MYMPRVFEILNVGDDVGYCVGANEDGAGDGGCVTPVPVQQYNNTAIQQYNHTNRLNQFKIR